MAVASRSGKMSRRLTLEWVSRVLEPEIPRLESEDSESIASQDSQATEIAGPSWSFNPPSTWTPEQHRIMSLRNATAAHRRPGVLLLIDSWGGHSSDSLHRARRTRHFHIAYPTENNSKTSASRRSGFQAIQTFRQDDNRGGIIWGTPA